jgi:hypothetical protein
MEVCFTIILIHMQARVAAAEEYSREQEDPAPNLVIIMVKVVVLAVAEDTGPHQAEHRPELRALVALLEVLAVVQLLCIPMALLVAEQLAEAAVGVHPEGMHKASVRPTLVPIVELELRVLAVKQLRLMGIQ